MLIDYASNLNKRKLITDWENKPVKVKLLASNDTMKSTELRLTRQSEQTFFETCMKKHISICGRRNKTLI